MRKRLLYVGLAAGVAAAAALVAHRAGFFAAEPVAAPTPPDTEEMWIVGEVAQNLSDLSRLIRNKPTSRAVAVKRLAEERGIPGYAVTAEGKTTELRLTASVWNPTTYQPLAAAILPAAGPGEPASDPVRLATTLLDPRFSVLEPEERRISRLLDEKPTSPGAHVQAALLMGTIGLNDHAGEFRDVRIPLNRMTAHLAAADHFGAEADDPGRRLAEAIRLTLCGQQAEALELLARMEAEQSGDTAWGSWIRLLRLRNTLDWRDGRDEAAKGPPALRHEYYRALVHAVGPTAGLDFLGGNPGAFEGLEEPLDPSLLPAAWRIPNERPRSVAEGHRVTKFSAGLELREILEAALALGLATGKQDIQRLWDLLDLHPGTFVAFDGENRPTVRVAGPDFWGGYFQRHFMQAVARTYNFLREKWGVHDQAAEFKADVLRHTPALRYRPFLERLMARTDEEYAATNPACIEIIEREPEMVTPGLWDSLRRDYRWRKVDVPIPDYHAWFRPEIPRGTAFEAGTRMVEIGVGDENDANWMAELNRRAPFEFSVIRVYVRTLAERKPEKETSELIRKHLGPLADYHVRAMTWLAESEVDSPADYERTMTKLAAFNPDKLIDLGDHFAKLGIADKAERYYREAFEKANDRVKMAVRSDWLVKRYHAQGRAAEAEAVAEAAGQTHSYGGLEVRAWLLEATGRHDEAQAIYRRIDERYEDGVPFNELAYLLRRRAQGVEAAPGRHEELAGRVFPRGVTRVRPEDFSGPPAQGVVIKEYAKTMGPFGLKSGDVIVALNGYRTDTFDQYSVVRNISEDPRMEFIFWDGASYRAAGGDLPARRFGVTMEDYRP